MPEKSRALIDRFLACRRIAFVGVSRKPSHFSRALYKEFQVRGYDLVPVNPSGGEIEGVPVATSIAAVTPPVEAALVMTPPDAAASVVEECASAGIRSLWLYRGGGMGSASPGAVAVCQSLGLEFVNGECPFMFFPKTQWFHGVHRGIRGLFGSLPK